MRNIILLHSLFSTGAATSGCNSLKAFQWTDHSHTGADKIAVARHENSIWVLNQKENLLQRFEPKRSIWTTLHTKSAKKFAISPAENPALIRPGRIDRKICFPYPDEKTKRRIFAIHSSKMSLAEDVNFEEFIMSKEDLTGADIKALCSESGLIALRERRMKCKMSDFRKSKDKVLYRKKGNFPDGLYI